MNQDDVKARVSEVLARDDLPKDVRDSLTKAVGGLVTPLQTDVWIYRIVVLTLGIIVFATVIGGIILAYVAHGDAKIALPEGIVAIGSAAVGALAGLLAPSPQTR